MTSETSRREFLQQSSQAAAVLTAAATLGGVHTFGAEKPAVVRLGIIGCGGIMTHHVQGLVNRREAVSIAWLCDVDPRQMEKMARHISRDFQPAPPKRTGTFEDVIKDKDVDACIIATPHHWHAPIALAAMPSDKRRLQCVPWPQESAWPDRRQGITRPARLRAAHGGFPQCGPHTAVYASLGRDRPS